MVANPALPGTEVLALMADLDGYDPSAAADGLAEIYDRWVVGLQDDGDDAVAFLAGLAERITPGGGRPRLLELGVGSGRIALPLARAGFAVTGVDASEPMLDLLRAKPGADAVAIVAGDFTEPAVDGPFDVVFATYNTLFSLLAQDRQVRCARNAAERLRPGGALVVQAFVPDQARFDRGARAGRRRELTRRGADVLGMGVVGHDRVAQLLDVDYELVEGGAARGYHFQFRYAWPSELDLMARLAGLDLEDRRGGWRGEPFTAASGAHVSVYRKPPVT
ncbi:class I SAM-dependent methyltransferase [Saccharothrix sp. HUAS TT1]|uniref:class I SAM-dependent methyltransferase n=1 Tax=unclassified Saccharothrix TaxID=2593673 RepID=UPI00345C0A18